jgi:hypothetical protein
MPTQTSRLLINYLLIGTGFFGYKKIWRLNMNLPKAKITKPLPKIGDTFYSSTGTKCTYDKHDITLVRKLRKLEPAFEHAMKIASGEIKPTVTKEQVEKFMADLAIERNAKRKSIEEREAREAKTAGMSWEEIQAIK